MWFFIAQLIEHYRANAEAMDSYPLEAFYFIYLFIYFFWGGGRGGWGKGLSCNQLKLYAFTFATIMSSFNNFTFPQFTLSLFHVSFLSCVKINSTNWPAPNVWVFVAQLVEHSSANAKANGSDTTQLLSFFFFHDTV